MDAKKIYEIHTGDIEPDNQIEYHEWYIRYVNWLEKNKSYTYNDLKEAFEAGRTYQNGEFNEYNGGYENEKPNFIEWHKNKFKK